MKLLVYKIIQFRIGYSKTLKEKTPVDILAPFNPKFLYHLFEFQQILPLFELRII